MSSRSHAVPFRALPVLAWIACVPACSEPSFSVGHPTSKLPPANAIGGMSITLPEVTLAPGEEAHPCFILPIELKGPSRMIAGGTVTVGPGMHHGNIMTRKTTGEGVRTCPVDRPGSEINDVFEGGTVLFGSSVQIVGSDWSSFPEGMAFQLKEGYEIVARMHYINSSPAPLVIAPTYEWFTVAHADVTQEVAPFLWLYRPFTLPPHSETTLSTRCELPTPMHIVNMLPHTHWMGTAVDASFVGGALDGRSFLGSRGYDPEQGTWVQYDQAIDLGQGTGVAFSCTYSNPLDTAVVEGESANNEMCMIGGYAFPPENTYSAIATGPEACLAVPVYAWNK